MNNIDRILEDQSTFRALVEGEEQRESIIAAERNKIRERGFQLHDEAIEIRREAVITTIGNEFFSEAEKRATTTRLAEAIVNRVMYKIGTESIMGIRRAGMDILEIARLRDVARKRN